ncbi:MAG: hypothetical protein ACHQF3_15260 [Alphaproteobacteria bacterium]
MVLEFRAAIITDAALLAYRELDSDPVVIWGMSSYDTTLTSFLREEQLSEICKRGHTISGLLTEGHTMWSLLETGAAAASNSVSDISLSNLPQLSNILLVYGPAALLIISISYVERRLRKNSAGNNNHLAGVSQKLYLWNWLFATAMAIAVFAFSAYGYFYGDTSFRGKFRNLTCNETLIPDRTD